MVKLSRSKLELFMKCPRCFWLDLKYGVRRPPGFPFTINSAIDYLFKQEFDIYREKREPHPIMTQAGIDAIPYDSPEINKWRDALRGGIQHHHAATDFMVQGGVDDIWVNKAGELIVVDYKSTGSNDPQIYDDYVRQLEIYQWLLRENGYKVSPTGYWVYAQVDKSQGFGNGKGVLPFHIFVKSAEGRWDWIAQKLLEARVVLDSPNPPEPSPECMTSGNQAFCKYRFDAMRIASIVLQDAAPKKAKQSTLDLS